MKPEDICALGEVFCKVLEQEAFVFALPIEKNGGVSINGELLRSAIRFTGNGITGVILISLQVALAREIAANILGEDSEADIVTQQADDALGELLNVLCGQFLTTVEGTEPVFDLSVPRVGAATAADWAKVYDRQSSLLFMVDDFFHVLVDLEVKPIGS